MRVRCGLTTCALAQMMTVATAIMTVEIAVTTATIANAIATDAATVPAHRVSPACLPAFALLVFALLDVDPHGSSDHPFRVLRR